MKHSIFLKLVTIILPLVLLADAVVLITAYRVTYNTTMKYCQDDVRQAAVIAAKYFEMFNPYILEDTEKCNENFNELCEVMDMTYIYTERLLIEQGNTIYLSIGFGKDAKESALSSLHTGSVSKMILDEEIVALTENKTVFFTYDNEYGNTITCFTPVRRHIALDSNSDDMVEETLSIACAEMSVDNIIHTVQHDFYRTCLLVIITSVLIIFMISFILQKKMAKPIRLISRKMSAFLLDREKEFEPIIIKGHDELSEMAHSFNSMVQEIDRYIEDISDLNREKTMQKAELDIARNIQMGFLEPTDFHNNYVDIHACMLPAKNVGGDLYDYQILSDGSICVIIADVSGKGISAALFMTNAITMLRQYAEAGLSPGRIMAEYNNHLANHNPNMMFITTFIGIYHPSTREFVYSNAGHTPPYLLSDTLNEIESSCETAAGVFAGETYTEKILKLKADDTLFLYTDGVTEAKNSDNQLFGDTRLKQILSERLNQSGENVMKAVLDSIKEFSGKAVQSDDITVLTLTIHTEKSCSLYLEAKTENLAVINQHLMSLDISAEDKGQLRLIAEEIFVNICSYAYDNDSGKAEVCITADDNQVTLTFIDSGKPFDPTQDIQNIDEYDMDTRIGGLGRFLTFNIADDYSYKYKNGRNILCITKNISRYYCT